MHDDVRRALESLLGRRVVAHTARSGGYTAARCWTVELDDRSRVFVKVATDDETTAGNRTELIVLRGVACPHLPVLVAASDDATMIVVEDLADAVWSPRPLPELDGFWEAVAAVGVLAAPPSLPLRPQGSGRDAWSGPLADARLPAALGVSAAWFERHGAALVDASTSADTTGEQLVHGDLAPGNWCRDRSGTWRFVDWAAAARGHPLIDDAIASIRLCRLDGETRSPRLASRPDIVTLVAGRFAAELLGVDWSDAPPSARADRVADIRAGLRLAAQLLELPDPLVDHAV